jgi:signal transduction histidine kinase
MPIVPPREGAQVGAAPSASRPADSARAWEPRARGSLRAKGLIALTILTLYVTGAALIVEWQRMTLAEIVAQLESAHAEEEIVGRVNFSLAQAILTANERYSDSEASDFTTAAVAAESVQTGVAALAARYPGLSVTAAQIGERLGALLSSGERQRLIDLRESLHGAVSAMDEVTGSVRARRKSLLDAYRAQYDKISITRVALGASGLLVLAGIVLLFLRRLAWDLRQLQERALAVVKGYRGPPLSVGRSDEIGALMHAVNRMQEDLRERETALELERQQRFHREKMASVGGIAAQIAHEINNPISAIAGVAQAIVEQRHSPHCAQHGALCQPELILEQAERISLITRQIAEYSSPQASERQLLDLNALVESTCRFVRYDRRLRTIRLELDLDRQLPALTAAGDQLTQVLMNLLFNAADAIAEARVPGRITVATRQRADEVVLTVSDNGTGMDERTRARAFDEFFTTKARGAGSGIGLALCRRLLREGGGAIELESQPGAGTVVAVRLALAPSAAVTPEA